MLPLYANLKPDLLMRIAWLSFGSLKNFPAHKRRDAVNRQFSSGTKSRHYSTTPVNSPDSRETHRRSSMVTRGHHDDPMVCINMRLYMLHATCHPRTMYDVHGGKIFAKVFGPKITNAVVWSNTQSDSNLPSWTSAFATNRSNEARSLSKRSGFSVKKAPWKFIAALEPDFILLSERLSEFIGGMPAMLIVLWMPVLQAGCYWCRIFNLATL